MQVKRVSLAELLSTAVPLGVNEATAIIGQLCGRVPVDSELPGPTPLGPEHVWLDRDGSVHLSPGVLPGVRELGALLEQLLGEVRRAGPVRLPPGLVLTTARATGRLDAAPLPSPGALASALARFAPPNPSATLQALFEAAEGADVGADARGSSEDQALVPGDSEIVAGDEHEYDAPAVAAPSADRQPLVLRRMRRLPLRPGVAGACAAAGLVAGIAVAVVLNSPDTATGRATDVTEVVIPGPSQPARQPPDSAPLAPAAPRGVAPPRTESTPAASGAVRPPDRSVKQPTSAPATEPAREQAAVPAPSTGAMRSPQRLIDPELVQADAVFSPSFAPTGSAIFFHAETADGSALKRAERGEAGVLHVATIVDGAAKNYHVQLSPDGAAVAFDSDRDGVRGVYVANSDGSGVRRVSGAGYAAVPTWSPDGRRLAFLRAENDRPSVWNLWALDLRSGDMTRLTNHRYGQVWSGAWFPDGRRVAYSHEDQLILLEIDSGRSTSYASPRKGRLVRTPAVSPDGRWVVFQVFRDGAWLLDLEAGGMQRVLDDPTAEEFTWAPDGRRVAFHSRRSGEWGLWTMAPR